jgi:hypothetical protein
MAVPSVMADLSTTAATNSPAGTESPSNADDFLRAIQAIVRTTNAKGADIASATTTDIGAATGEFIDVTGTTTITGLGTIGAGIVRTVRFTGALTLTHNATSLILPGGANITTAANDRAIFRSLGSGNWLCVAYMKADGKAVVTTLSDDAVTALSLSDSSLGFSMVNGTITATVAASALTIAIKTKAGTDPSATDPVHILFRNVTAGTGDYTVISLVAATSLVISSGSTIGTTSGVANKLWVVGFNDAGTFRLGAINLSTNAPFGDDVIASSTAEGGAGGADSAGVYYTGTAVTSKAMKVLGYVESTQATAGTWATSPSKVQLLTAGTKLHGDVVQQNVTYTGAVATGTTIMPFDDTIPQITEGTEFMTVSITPSSATSILLVEVTAFMACSISERIASAIFQDATANALGAGVTLCPSTNGSSEHVYSIRLQANTTSSTTFRFRAGPASAATVTFNGSAGGRIFGGFMASNLRVTEIAS